MAKWLSPAENCDVCGTDLNKQSHFIDGQVFSYKHGRYVWALVCESCHQQLGIGLGLGKGQRYDTKTKEKVEG